MGEHLSPTLPGYLGRLYIVLTDTASQKDVCMRDHTNPVDSAVMRGLGASLGTAVAVSGTGTREADTPSVLTRQQLRALTRSGSKRFVEIRQVGNRLVTAPQGRLLVLRWASTGRPLVPGELAQGTRVTVCRDTGLVSLPGTVTGC